MFYNNNLTKYLQLCLGLFLVSVLIISNLNVADAANSLSCPTDLPICNSTTVANYHTPLDDDNFDVESNEAQVNKAVSESKDLGTGDAVEVQASLPANTSKSIDVPYINQYKDKNGNVWGTRYHCGAAAASIVAGYFDRFPYKGDDDDQYRKYMNTNSGQGITDKCNGQGGAFGVTGFPDRSSSAYCKASYPDGVSKYLKKIGLKYKIVAGTGAGLGMISIGTVKAAINRGNPVIISSGAHYYVIKGYTDTNKVIVNDSWKDATKSSAFGANTFNWGSGKNAVYDLKNLYPGHPSSYRDVRFAWEVSTPDTSFYNGEKKSEEVSKKPEVKAETKPEVKVTPVIKTPVVKQNNTTSQIGTKIIASGASDDSEGLNVRATAGGEINNMVYWDTNGEILETPVTVNGIPWAKVKWENGIEGWSANYYLKPTDNSQAQTKSTQEVANTTIPTEVNADSKAFTSIKLASDKTKCLDLRASTISQYNPLQIWNCNGTNAQNWVMPSGQTHVDEIGQIKLFFGDKFCVDFNGQYEKPLPGMNIYLALCDNESKSATEWFVDEKGQIHPAYDDTLCIGIKDDKTTKGNTLELQTCNDSITQKFVM